METQVISMNSFHTDKITFYEELFLCARKKSISKSYGNTFNKDLIQTENADSFVKRSLFEHEFKAQTKTPTSIQPTIGFTLFGLIIVFALEKKK